MKIATRIMLTALMLGIPVASVLAGTVTVSGKNTSKITGHVTSNDVFEVTDGKGGWQDNLVLQGGSLPGEAYSGSVPIQVRATDSDFTLTLVKPLQLVNTKNSQLVFSATALKVIDVNSKTQLLTPGTALALKNPEPAEGESESTGNYNLQVEATPPEGRDNGGVYSGEIDLIFEPATTSKAG